MTTDYPSDVSLTTLGQAGAPGASPRNVNFKRMLRMRGPLMVGVTLALALPLMVAVWFVVPREYTAMANIRFSNSRPTVLTGVGGSAVSTDYVTHVQTQVNVIKGAAVLEKVLDSQARGEAFEGQNLRVRDLPLLKNERDPLRYLEKHVNTWLIPTTELVAISYACSDKDTAIAVVRAVIDEYLKWATTAEKARNDSITRQLIDEKDSLEKRVADLRANVGQKRESVSGVQLPGANSVDSELRAYHDGLSRALSDQTTAEKHIEQVKQEMGELENLMEQQKLNPEQPIYPFGIEEAISQDSAVAVQTQMLAAHEAEYAQAKNRYLEGHPQVRVLEEARKAAEASLREAQAAARGKLLLSRYEDSRLELEKATSYLEDAKARVVNFDSELQKHAADSLEVSKAMTAVREEEEALEDSREDLKDVQERIRFLNVESRAPASIEVAVNAYAPTDPDYGRRLKLMALVLMGSCGVGVAAGLWRELTDQQVRSAQDISYCTELPLMAVVPHGDVDHLPKDANIALVTAEHGDSISADEVRRVLTRIIYPPEGSAELNTCLITSASRGDGKTTMACNLAIALSQANRRVLLVDVCARRPSVEKRLGMQSAAGLSEIFAGEIRMIDAVRTTQFPNLSVLGPGLHAKDLIGKLASRETVEFLEQAEEAYEHVIIDTPPVLLMSDAKLIAPVVDGVIVVIGAEVSTLGMVRRSLSELQQIGANVMGVVLNRVKHMPGGYMRHHLSNYYNYATEQHGDHHAGATTVRTTVHAQEHGDEDAPSIILVEDEHETRDRGEY